MFISKTYNFDLLVIDLLNLLFRFVYNNKEDISILYTKLLNNILYIKNILGVENTNIIFLTDYNFISNNSGAIISNSQKNYIKSQIDNNYKVNRKYNFSNKDLNSIKEIVKLLSHNYKIFYANGYEADDIANYIYTTNLKEKSNKKIAYYTLDKDWWQYITDNSKIVINKNKNIEIIDLTYSYKTLNFYITQNNYNLYKAIFGDKSDNILVSYNKTKKIEIKQYIIENFNSFYRRDKLNNLKNEDKFLDSMINYLVDNNLINKNKFIINLKLIKPLELSKENIEILKFE